MHNPIRTTATPYLAPTSHRTVQLSAQSHPSSHCHSIQPFVQAARSPPFAFESPSLDLVTPSHPFHLSFNDNTLSTAHPGSRAATSSGQSLPSEFGLQLQHYLSASPKGDRCPRTPERGPMVPWSLPMISSVAPAPGIDTSRPWPKTTGPTLEVFVPGVNAQPYPNFMSEPTDNNTNFSSEREAFHPAALPTLDNSILVADTHRPRDQAREPVVYFSGSESDSGQELDDERNIAHDARRDQWMSASTASPRSKSPAVTLSRRFASFLATEVPACLYLPAYLAYFPILGNKIGSKSSPSRHRLPSSTTTPYSVVF
ncbi:hypothetical protein BJV78DRAFT_507282 [Lactifluus subvellereus]|nr:hypothetical protein BJV78DRAFT_507282 [Lactifluus subvellereus]